MIAKTDCYVSQSNLNLSPAKIVLLYFFIGTIWIVFSDTFTSWLVNDVNLFRHIGIFKGMLFIFSTTCLLQLLIRNYTKQLEASLGSTHLAEQRGEKIGLL